MTPAMRRWSWILVFWLLLSGGLLVAFGEPRVRALALFEFVAAGVLVIAMRRAR